MDDSQSLVFGSDGWLEGRSRDERDRDLYFFGYGSDYQASIGDFYRISGRTPMIPRWSLGNWWSRYWRYRQDELLGLMADFQAFDVPLSVCVVDMDWHLVDLEGGRSGWTGYSWNRELFPRPQALLEGLHDAGLRTTLNLHPALGIRPHEDQYEAFATRLGVNPESGLDIPFDIASKEFALAYFDLLHHPHEDEGVDFWWVDWQQGEDSNITGLDPLWMLNHLHFLDHGRDGDRRALILSRWGGLGSQRYPVGFSGDTHITWNSLAFQPYFTATAANVGYGWWSHDIGGHMLGIEDQELFTRWIQFGVFSPIMRLHSTNNPFVDRRPWAFDAEVFRIARDTMQLRHALIPYLYTMARTNSEEGRPLIRPMYHDYPEDEAAYFCPRQYLFGNNLVAAPFVTAADPDSGMSRQFIWLPPGSWYNFFTGEHYEGDACYALYGKLDDIPLFARAGAIIPIGPMVGWGGIEAPDELDLHVFAGDGGEFTLFEDDGETRESEHHGYCETHYSLIWEDHGLRFKISAVDGSRNYCPSNRQYRLHLHGIKEPQSIEVIVRNNHVECERMYDEKAEKLVLYGISIRPSDTLRVLLKSGDHPLISHRERTIEICREMLWMFKLESRTKWALDRQLDEILQDPTRLSSFEVKLSEPQSRALFETIYKAGIDLVDLYDKGRAIVIWNNLDNKELRYHYSAEREEIWITSKRFMSAGRQVPRFEAISLETPWSISIVYGQLFQVCYRDGLTKQSR